jgi:hypothetical protein
MAPFDQYPMERNAEITLARSAAPQSISPDAEIIKRLARTLCGGDNQSDSTRLTSLVQELIEALDQGERSWRPAVCRSNAMAAESGSRLRAIVFAAD